MSCVRAARSAMSNTQGLYLNEQHTAVCWKQLPHPSLLASILTAALRWLIGYHYLLKHSLMPTQSLVMGSHCGRDCKHGWAACRSSSSLAAQPRWQERERSAKAQREPAHPRVLLVPPTCATPDDTGGWPRDTSSSFSAEHVFIRLVIS